LDEHETRSVETAMNQAPPTANDTGVDGWAAKGNGAHGFTQANRRLRISTPLDPDALLITSLTGTESISTLFQFRAELLGRDERLDFDAIVGKSVTVAIAAAGGDRYVNGIVSRFAQSGTVGRHASYTAHIVAWPWFLTRTTDCRIFQKKTVPEIVEQLFGEYGLTDFRFQLEGRHEPREYCVQYRETDYDFIARLLEDEGIFFFFVHENGKHTLVLADAPRAHDPCPVLDRIRFTHEQESLGDEDVVTTFSKEQGICAGKVTHTDYCFETPSIDLLASVAGSDARGLELYDYPACVTKRDRSESLARIRQQEVDAARVVFNGAGYVRSLAAGYKFQLKAAGDGVSSTFDGTYVVTGVQHRATESYAAGDEESDLSYQNEFSCIEVATPFRPARTTPRPVMHGVQTAKVVGPAGEEIFVDEYGRVKVQFHWDREGKWDENSSCWIRISQDWAGKNWGIVSIPRIGQEVIVSFLEGDADQPLITGRVYNAEQMPPYALPANRTQSGIKSRTSVGGTADNFNELRFEDKRGAEEIFLHAEKNWKIHVKDGESKTVGSSISTTAGGGISRTSGGDHSRTTDQNIKDKAKVDITTNSGKNMELQAGGSYSLLTNLGIHLKAMNFVAAMIESGAKEAAKAIKKGAAATGVAAGVAGYRASDGAGGGQASLEAGFAAVGEKAAAGAQQAGMQALAALAPGIEAGAAEINRLSTEASQGMSKLEGPVNKAITKMDALKTALEKDASPEVIAEAFMSMAEAAMAAWDDAKKIIEGLLPQIPSIVLWAMKDIQATALWSMQLTTRVKNIDIEAKNKDVNIKAKKNLNLEAKDKVLNLKASKKDVLITGKEKVNIKAEDKDLVIEAGNQKVVVKAAKQIFLKCGSASISMSDKGNIVIKGSKINIKGTGPIQAKGAPIKLN
jgi:type VI secretion system secreted protein VgrG